MIQLHIVILYDFIDINDLYWSVSCGHVLLEFIVLWPNVTLSCPIYSYLCTRAGSPVASNKVKLTLRSVLFQKQHYHINKLIKTKQSYIEGCCIHYGNKSLNKSILFMCSTNLYNMINYIFENVLILPPPPPLTTSVRTIEMIY